MWLQMFKDAVYRAEFNIEYNKHPTLEKYIDECISCDWLMSVQDPPMDLRWQKAGDHIELDSFRFYDRTGKTVELAVWPAVCLYHGGPLVSKGYVLPKDAEQWQYRHLFCNFIVQWTFRIVVLQKQRMKSMIWPEHKSLRQKILSRHVESRFHYHII